MNHFTIPTEVAWVDPPPNPFDEIAAGRTTLEDEVAAGRIKVTLCASEPIPDEPVIVTDTRNQDS